MKRFPAFCASLLVLSPLANADILISQYYEGTSFNKWIELTNTDAAPATLDGLVLTLWSNANSENWKSGGGAPTEALALDGSSIPGNGFLLVAHPSAVLPAYATANLSSSGDNVANFNGDDSVVLYDTALGLVGETAAIADAIGFTDAGNEGSNKSIYRLAPGVGYDTTLGTTFVDFPAVWAVKTNGEVDSALEADPWYLQGFVATDALTVTLSTGTVAENAGVGVVDVTVERTGDTTAALDVTLAGSDDSEAIVVSPSVQIPAGMASETFTMAIDAVDDLIADGTKTVTITATATGFEEGTANLDVTDNGDVQDIVINEALADPPLGDAGDVNLDGFRSSSQDEFVELVNVSGAPLDISLWTISDPGGVNHTFPDGTVLATDCAVVVFGGGSTAALGGTAIFQVATNGFGLGLSNTSDTVLISDDLGQGRAELVYTSGAGNDESLTRDPDLTGSFVGHTGATGSGGDPFSPGALNDGLAQFCPGVGDLSVSLSAATMNENGGTLTATITRTGNLTSELVVNVRIDDSSEAEAVLTGFGTETIPATQASVQVVVNGVDDIAPDGPQLVTISVSAPDYGPGEETFTVEDDGDGVFDSLVINEFLYDPPSGLAGDANGDGTRDGADDEFVELLNVSGADFDLSGLELHDSAALRHVFPPGTVLADQQAIVVFGGPMLSGFFGGSVVQVASEGLLGLNNSGGDSVVLRDASGGELLRVDYVDPVTGESLVRDPDGTGAFVAHSGATGSGGALFSAGNMSDGAAFAGGSSTPPPIEITKIVIDYTFNEVVMDIKGLQSGFTYNFEASDDLGDADPWLLLQSFTSDAGIPVGNGSLQFLFPDFDIPSNPEQYYRIVLP